MKTVFNSARYVGTHDSEDDKNMDAKKWILISMVAAI